MRKQKLGLYLSIAAAISCMLLILLAEVGAVGILVEMWQYGVIFAVIGVIIFICLTIICAWVLWTLIKATHELILNIKNKGD